MKRYIAFIALSAALLCLNSCKKEENGKVLFKATIESPVQQGKTAIASDGTMTWRSDDQIVVFYGQNETTMDGRSILSTTSTGKTAEFTPMGITPTGGHYYAVYPTNIAGSSTFHNIITLPPTQAYHAAEDGKVQFEAPMYAYSTTDQLAFKNLCGVVRLSLTTSKTISRIVVSANEQLCGEFNVSWNGGVPTLTATSTEGGTSVEFTCGSSGVDCTDGADFYLYLPVNEAGYTGMQFAFYTTDGSYITKTLKSDQRFYVGRNTLNPLEFDLPPVGAKGGLFTINVDGGQVWFSQGNLQYYQGSQTWHFADEQYYFVGSDNSNIGSDTYTGPIDLFGWGTGQLPTLYSTDNADYSTFENWGRNAIDNGGNTPDLWRTLTAAEWTYLFNTRTTNTNLGTTNARYVAAKVNSKNGVILFPDSYTHPSGITSPSYINGTASGWSSNIYSSTDWTAMEAAGAVFLPAAGNRSGMTPSNIGSYCQYWSSNEYDGTRARLLGFTNWGLFTPNTNNIARSTGCSVRLVKDN